jgi:hypothetical protein
LIEHKCDHINSKMRWDVGMPESMVRNLIKHAGEINEKGKVASSFCCLWTATRNRSVTMMEIEHLLSVWI